MLLLLFSEGGAPITLNPLTVHTFVVAGEDRGIRVRGETRRLTVARENRQMTITRRP